MKETKNISYSYLVRRALWISIQIVIILVFLIYFKEIVNFFILIYGF